jgi:uncharacterized membrane protein YkvA (DUF1232 family)
MAMVHISYGRPQILPDRPEWQGKIGRLSPISTPKSRNRTLCPVSKRASFSAVFQRLRARVRNLKEETYALYLACRDPRVPWYAKLLAAIVVAYALSPIDLIPDFIPILGYLDDLLIVPAGIALAVKLIPEEILHEHRARASVELESLPRSRLGAAIVLGIWALVALWIASILWRPDLSIAPAPLEFVE